MSIAASDLVLFCSANMPNDDASTAGGAIDLLRRPDFTQIAANDSIEAVSSSAGDTTQTLTITARKADGTVVTETKTMNGTTVISFSVNGTVERVLKAELSATCAGTVTVRRSSVGPTVRTIPIGERGFVMMFRQLAADVSTGATRNFYAKCFWKNTHGTLALLAATVKQNADADARITHLLANATGDSATTTNRVTVPSAGNTQDPDTFDDTDKAVPGTDLAAAGTIGTWFRMQLPAGDTAHKYSYISEFTGQST